MEHDWRLVNQINYLYKKKLERQPFFVSATRDHEHCSFCWNKFGELDGMLHEGYCTADEQYWICDHCFEDFKEMFQWQLNDQ